ncbi:amidohydrolase family-domain-containing protein [Lactarius indigo]|nr:amidohydrolase family-domain-containing protein [Lactarius indigo]
MTGRDLSPVGIPDTYAICTPPNSIYTVDDDDSTAECMLVENGVIRSIGSAGNPEHIRNFWGACNPNVSLKMFQTPPNSVIVPGLGDAHGHILLWGAKERLPLHGSASIEDVLLRIKQYLLSHPDILHDPARWILGSGWDQTGWPGGEFPTADDLDREPLLRGRSIVLARIDWHANWVSNAVLSELTDLPDVVDGGLIVRDEAGKPTGVFVDNAMSLIHKPGPTDAEVLEDFETTMRDALRVGLTTIHDAGSLPSTITFFQRQIRVYMMGLVDFNDDPSSQIPRLIDYGLHRRLTVRSVKLFADGALGSWGAALKASGFLLTSTKTLHQQAEKLYEDGFQVNVHAIGDHANEVVLDIFEDILKKPGADVNTWRPRIEHAQIFQPSDIERIGRLGVIASVQPTHATSDMNYAESRLGPDRIKGAYAYQKLIQVSPAKRLPLGSDFPVEGINPLLGFYAAIARLSPEGTSPHGPGGWYPAEALTRVQALRGMTRDKHTRGQLAPGFAADFVLLDRDIMQVPLEEILSTRVLATVIDGRVAYGSL